MFPGWLQVFFRMIISNERSKGTRWSSTIWWSQLIDDPQLFDDPQPFDVPQLFYDQLEVWTLIIQKSMVIPSSPMVLFIILYHRYPRGLYQNVQNVGRVCYSTSHCWQCQPWALLNTARGVVRTKHKKLYIIAYLPLPIFFCLIRNFRMCNMNLE